eukprot:10750841-Alexandrium_andersonii.AAC.1
MQKRFKCLNLELRGSTNSLNRSPRSSRGVRSAPLSALRSESGNDMGCSRGASEGISEGVAEGVSEG